MTDWPRGTDRIILDTTDSTNADARRRAEAGVSGPVWIMAHRQTAGRGRMGRIWATSEGNIAATYMFPFPGAVHEAARLGFTAALAVADTLEALVRGAEVGLKWPNDVLLNGGKASGVLLESFGQAPDGRLRVAIGIGMNLAHHPPRDETHWPATSVSSEGMDPPDPVAVLDLLAPALDWWLTRFATGFAPIRDAWLGRAANLHGQIEVRLPKETLNGRFADLDADGALVLETAGGLRHITAGDVFIPGSR